MATYHQQSQLEPKSPNIPTLIAVSSAFNHGKFLPSIVQQPDFIEALVTLSTDNAQESVSKDTATATAPLTSVPLTTSKSDQLTSPVRQIAGTSYCIATVVLFYLLHMYQQAHSILDSLTSPVIDSLPSPVRPGGIVDLPRPYAADRLNPGLSPAVTQNVPHLMSPAASLAYRQGKPLPVLSSLSSFFLICYASALSALLLNHSPVYSLLSL